MTPDEIRQLKPGPEMDRAVGITLFDAEDGLMARWRAYSTTWVGLGLVVEEMERRGWYMGGGRESVPGQRMVGYGRPGPDEKFGRAVSAPTYMEAACKAALLTLAAEKERTPRARSAPEAVSAQGDLLMDAKRIIVRRLCRIAARRAGRGEE